MCVFLLRFLELKKLRFGFVHSVGFRITVSLHFLFVLSCYLISLRIFQASWHIVSLTVRAQGTRKISGLDDIQLRYKINLVAIINHEHINDIVVSISIIPYFVTMPLQVSSGSTSTRSSYSDVMTQTESILGWNGRIWRWWCSMFSS